MPSPTLIQTLLSSLLDSPIVEIAASEVGKKALSTIKAHFTLSAQKISTAYQDSYGYTLSAISVGVVAREQNFTLAQKIFNSKITREFAEQIDRRYLQPFAKQQGLSSQDLPAFRKQAAKSLNVFAKHKDKIFQFEQVSDDDLMALVSYRDTTAITDLVLEQMQRIEPVDDSLAAFLRFEGQVGDGILFFFRELIRQDDRLEKTQAALQRDGLCLSVPKIEESIEHLKAAQQGSPILAAQLAPQLKQLQQAQISWQIHHEQLIRFSRGFDIRLDSMLEWAKDVYSTLDQIHDDVIETKKDVKFTKNLVEDIFEEISDLKEMMARQGLSSQIKARDEFTQHNSASLQLIGDAVSHLKRLSPENTEYSRLSIMVGSALSSTGDLVHAERSFKKAIECAQNEADKALAFFNLFQVLLRRKAYAEALKNLQAAIAIVPQRYALHDIHKYPLEKLLGAGGMGCVFLCRNDNELIRNKRVVVKCFWENLKGSLSEVFREPFVMRDIAGDFVPKPLDVGYANPLEQERAFFVSEYVDGAVDGEEWLEKYGQMDLKMGLAVGLKIADGLRIAHEAGIFHLDLKPANILLVKKSAGVFVKLIDFGLSRVSSLRDEAVVVQQSRSGLSVFGQAIFGTLDYAPPEQRGLSGYGVPSARSDLYAFGMTMFRLFSGREAHSFRERHLPNVPVLRALLGDCVEGDPNDRPVSAREVVSRLKGIVNGLIADERRAEVERSSKEKLARERAERQAEEERLRKDKLARERAERQAEEERLRKEKLARERAQRQAEEEERKRKSDIVITAKSPGDILRKARTQKNLSVQQVADQLYLDYRLIEGLEANKYEGLPPPLFLRGYLRNYAKILELMPGDLLEAFDKRNEGKELVSDLPPTFTEEKEVTSRNLWHSLTSLFR